ncbi:hypothetical protein ABRY95_01395 [Castellaniella ginsengisoli]|jgi:hypothetical protein|uniref:UrcA family protein n=1 Tax=Castellaniella ginsengisoli TaxID=546114 RepID=A0AB39ED94_9BURK
MRRHHPILPHTALLAAGLGYAALFAPAAQAAGTPSQSQYQQDVARCHNTPGIDVQACLKEAGAAAQAATRDALTQPSPQVEARNRNQRCDSLPERQRQDCMILMNDANAQTRGSVESGGTLRETTITIPAPAAGS